MSLKNLSIKNKLVGIILVVVMLAVGIGFTTVIVINIASLEQDLVNNVWMNATLVSEYCVVPMIFEDEAALAKSLQTLHAIPFIENGYIYDLDNNTLATYDRTGSQSEPPPLDQGDMWYFEDDHLHVIQSIVYNDRELGILHLRASTRLLDERIRKYLWTMIGIALGLIALSYFFALKLQSVVSVPILSLAAVTRNITQSEDYSLRVQAPRSDEIGELYAGFNSMLDQINSRESERDVAEEALRESEEKFHKAFISSPDAVTISRLDDGRLVDVNEGLEHMLGFSRKEILGKTTTELGFFENPGVRNQIRDIMQADGHVGNFEVRLRHKSGKILTALLSVELIDLHGEPHLLAITRDITERKNAEKEREKLIAELEAKNSELERFAYTVSHDLKGPLITITGFAGLLATHASEGDSTKVADDVGRISKAADKMAGLLDSLLELSRVGRIVNPIESICMDELVQEAVELTTGRASAKGIVPIIVPGMPTIRGDRPRMLEVLQNLLENAFKYIGDQPHPRVEVGCRQQNGEAQFYVSDNGIGIDPRFHEKVFGLFDQLNPGSDGTGIGLALVKRIVENHGGRVYVESDGDHEGSTFCFTVPGEQVHPAQQEVADVH